MAQLRVACPPARISAEPWMIGILSPGNWYDDSSSRTSSSTRSSSSGSSTMSHLVQEHHDRRHADLARQQDVLARLRHRAVRRRHHQDRAVHLRRARDHVLHVVRVAGAVDMRVVAVLRLVLHMRRRDRDPARLLLRRLVDLVIGRERRPARLRQHLRDRRRQRRLPMVNVTDRPDVAVRLVPLKFRLRHGSRSPSSVVAIQPAILARTSSATACGTCS